MYKNILIILVAMLFFEFSDKREVLIAENHYDFEGTCKLTLYSDLSYQFSGNKTFHSEGITNHSGTYLVKSDTVLFAGQLSSVFGNTAIIKNGFIEVLDGFNPFKFEIVKQDIIKMERPDISKANNYTIFSYTPKFYSNIFPAAKPYDLTNKDIRELDLILLSCLRTNSITKKIALIKSNMWLSPTSVTKKRFG